MYVHQTGGAAITTTKLLEPKITIYPGLNQRTVAKYPAGARPVNSKKSCLTVRQFVVGWVPLYSHSPYTPLHAP